MIRNVVTGRLAPSADAAAAARLDAGLAGIAGLRLPGLLRATVGRDAGLREGGWDFAIVNDFVDADAYRGYDRDPEHQVHRAAIVAVCAEVARVQFEIAD